MRTASTAGLLNLPALSTKTIKVEVRLIAATNRDLRRMVEEHDFRDDLYYRLNVFPIQIPPLRERPEDLPALVRIITKSDAAVSHRRVHNPAR